MIKHLQKYLTFSFLLVLVVTALGQNVSFQEKFLDNHNRWIQSQSETVKAQVKNGHYILERTQEGGANFFNNDKIQLDPSKDFSFEMSFKHLSGDTVYGSGVFWGAADGHNFFALTLSKQGVVSYYKYEEGVFTSLWQSKPLIDMVSDLGVPNKLRVQQFGEFVLLFLNDNQIHQSAYLPMFGAMHGVLLNSKMKITVEEIRVVEGYSNDGVVNEGPSVEWFNPQNKVSTTFQNFITVEAGVKSLDSLKFVELFVNHEKVLSQRGIRQGQIFNDIVYQEIELIVGINEVKLVAEDLMGRRSQSTRLIKLQENKTLWQRNDYALLFATNEYDEWGNLINPIHDAKTIAKELQQRYGFKVEVVENVSTSEVMSTLKRYAQKEYNRNDQLFIFFAGHGKYDEDFGEGYVVCKNSMMQDMGNTSMLSHSSLRTVVNNIPCNHIFLMMDVCFGGTFAASGGVRGGNQHVYDELSRQQFIRNKLKYKTRKYLTSGGKEYVPDGQPGNHSPFARKVLEALRSNGGEDKILTLAELLHYLERLTPMPRSGEFGVNEPGSEFMFIVNQ